MNKRYIVPFGELKNVMYRPSKAKSTLQGKKQTNKKQVFAIPEEHMLNNQETFLK